MWLQILLLAAAPAVVQGICFGSRFLQSHVECDPPLVYYPDFCICDAPENHDRHYAASTYRKLPMSNTHVDPSQTFKNKLEALRYRMIASLPDMSTSGRRNSVGDTHAPANVFPDGLRVSLLPYEFVKNYFPRSWRLSTLFDPWSGNTKLPIDYIPSVKTGGMFSRSGRSWVSDANKLSSLSLMERLHSLRNQWREATQSQAERRFAESLIAEKFFKNTPTTGISPDSSKTYPQTLLGNPDGYMGALKQRESEKQPSFLSLKKAALAKQRLDRNLPKETQRRANSFVRSARRLAAAGQ